MTTDLLLLVTALILDLLVGDPSWLLHPTQVMGAGINLLERLLWRPGARPAYLISTGGILVVIIMGTTWTVTRALLWLAGNISHWLEFVLAAWLLATTIAPRGLATAGRAIARALKAGDLGAARRQVGLIVGRDTDSLTAIGVTRATVETIAENTSDGVVAPLFYFFLGGVPLAMVYRAINTLDSMLGYKNERYLFFGRMAARLDDLANYVPARITGLAICVAAFLLGQGRRAWITMLRDARKHPSPNSGYPEAAMAGALGVQLGGLNYYQGIPSHRPLMGQALRELEPGDIDRAITLMAGATAIITMAGCIYLAFRIYWH
ncbi:adenosylcobinamide-phosphate synthase CbiB [Neomoorella thermoacetica]|uniref:Cobalamin biosynthesis protein CobD n=1 Tax=Moorella thermoacetica (strain ATCC 39073 / JCM 9320) TaxID=264732 RepID=Q2RJH6_MOOTA|nr:adenosylcobinamide-phosphate synthase CbiB [Moorella thermoacetica]AKX96503.1 cobalamin biosynthesis protein CbiB [Moorella thermoacetica]OIQ56232.1 cobalamin biosynthesis protein CbiB [Moorella thermoacetica]OIQ57673.1 cobalamin biosynthesis protein CbiB [Moorella thermoacetica]OIQ61697.1 cobalamin biosynthesis protein CbiB [Moorella thermoacetica]QDA00317.1 cobalamin biosynthesis protein [Moorella thermoacetica]